jgi:hypothetical protein
MSAGLSFDVDGEEEDDDDIEPVGKWLNPLSGSALPLTSKIIWH